MAPHRKQLLVEKYLSFTRHNLHSQTSNIPRYHYENLLQIIALKVTLV